MGGEGGADVGVAGAAGGGVAEGVGLEVHGAERGLALGEVLDGPGDGGAGLGGGVGGWEWGRRRRQRGSGGLALVGGAAEGVAKSRPWREASARQAWRRAAGSTSRFLRARVWRAARWWSAGLEPPRRWPRRGSASGAWRRFRSRPRRCRRCGRGRGGWPRPGSRGPGGGGPARRGRRRWRGLGGVESRVVPWSSFRRFPWRRRVGCAAVPDSTGGGRIRDLTEGLAL